jgi:hypothetical protein
MGQISIAAFRPRAGKSHELLAVISDRLPLLRRLGLVTDRPAITVRAVNGVIVHISEWVNKEAIERAHSTPEVLELWKRFDACSEYVSLTELDESHEPFATFDAV